MKVSRPRRISVIWLAPVFAALAVGYLVYDILSQRGPMIYVTFSDAQGVIERKTPLKFEGVEVGKVEDLDVDFDTGAITFHIRLDADAAAVARDGSQFWIQNPKIGLLGVEDLDTLISGPYVSCLTGDGDPTTKFQGLNQNPPPLVSRPGLRVSLRADELGALEVGSAVLYRGLNVGTVERVGLSENAEQATIDLFIEHNYSSLVRPDSSFWEVSGLQLNVDLKPGTHSGHAEPAPGLDRRGGFSIARRRHRRSAGVQRGGFRAASRSFADPDGPVKPERSASPTEIPRPRSGWPRFPS